MEVIDCRKDDIRIIGIRRMENSAVRVVMCDVALGCAGGEIGIWGARSLFLTGSAMYLCCD